MIVLMMQLDSILLCLAVLSALIIASEDTEISWPCRALIAAGILGAFSQAAWLNGYWTPGSAGYPWARLMFDAAISGLAVLRAYTVLKRLYATRRRTWRSYLK